MVATTLRFNPFDRFSRAFHMREEYQGSLHLGLWNYPTVYEKNSREGPHHVCLLISLYVVLELLSTFL
jgi:hypothetical protein